MNRKVYVTGLLIAFLFLGCSAPQQPQPDDLLTQMYMKSSSELFALKYVYNACKTHLATDGQGKMRMCQDIASIKGDDKARILAVVILNDFKIDKPGQSWTLSTREGDLY
jgi:hypothetical protein